MRYYIYFPRENKFELFLKNDGKLSDENTPISEALTFSSVKEAQDFLDVKGWIMGRVCEVPE